MRQTDAACALIMSIICVKWRHARHLIWRHIRNPNPSLDTQLQWFSLYASIMCCRLANQTTTDYTELRLVCFKRMYAVYCLPIVAGNGVAEFGDSRPKRWQSRISATVAVFGESRRKRQLSPNSATVAEFGDCSRQCGQGLKRLHEFPHILYIFIK